MMSIFRRMRQHPTLNAILVVQILAILVSSGVMIWSIQLSLQTDEKVRIQKHIAQIEHSTEEGLSRWITWSILGMGTVINRDIEKTLSDFGVLALTIRDTSLNTNIITYERPELHTEQDTKDQLQLTLPWEEMDKHYEVSLTFVPVLPPSQYHLLREHGFVILMVLIGILVLSLLATTYLFNSNIVKPMRTLFSFIKQVNHTDYTDMGKLSFEGGEICALSRYVVSTIKEVKNYEGQRGRLKLARQVAHDIRSPLMALKVCIPQLSRNPDGVKDLILDASSRIEQIANDLLSSTKTQQSSYSQTYPSFFLAEALEMILKEKTVEFDSQQPTLELVLGAGCPLLQMNLEASDFKRVLSNLINNAIEAVPSELGPRVKISATCAENSLQITVEDNGIGVSKDLFGKLCEEGFSQDKENGNGIGLSFAQDFVRRQGGVIGFSNSPLGGLCVKLEFPNSSFFGTASLEGLNRILIIDDDRSVVGSLKNLLRAKVPHIDTVVAKTPKDLLFNIDFNPYDRVLVDYDLGMEGFTGLDLVRDRNLVKKALIVTANHAELRAMQFVSENQIPIFPKSLIQYLEI